mmetsp:Transcript_30458/g.99368  ORF Transcript_30458/g.99368 Transcript_30458/m.99368 type:complete len:223 (+) Transcript_30458:127-795(+)
MTVHDRTAHAPDGAWSTSLVPRQQLVGTSEGAVSLLGSFGQRPRRSASDSQSVLCRLRRAHAALEALSRRRTQHRAPRQTSCGSSIRRSGAQSPTAPRRARVRETRAPPTPRAPGSSPSLMHQGSTPPIPGGGVGGAPATDSRVIAIAHAALRLTRARLRRPRASQPRGSACTLGAPGRRRDSSTGERGSRRAPPAAPPSSSTRTRVPRQTQPGTRRGRLPR